jgi:tryptophanyl-tRNA synthetase
MSKQVVLTGLRTNAEYHLGNYLGAILPMVDMAKKRAGEYQINMFAPDLHSFTTPIDHSSLYTQTMNNLRLFVACGLPIDNDDVYIYRQSMIPAHSELTVILNNFAYFGELSRMTEFKDKSGKDENFSAGLFDYPVLMASDILLYGAQWVPVGEDQRQHLEFARDIAGRLNNKFGELFVLPKTLKEQQEFVARDSAPRIRSLKYPDKKMSKSVDDPSGTIKLSDTPEEATKKIMSATTDNEGVIRFDWDKQPGITNLLQILAILTDKPQVDVNSQWEQKTSYGDLKKAVSEAVSSTLETIQANLAKVDASELEAKLLSSEKAMNEQANNTLLKVQKAVGLRA